MAMATTQPKAKATRVKAAEGNGSAATPALKPKKCASARCGKKFTPTKEWQLYCSSTCSNRERGARERARYREMRDQLATAGQGGRKGSGK